MDQAARASQMLINTRLTALQAAQGLMQTQGYTGAFDHIMLLAMAADIESYILGDMLAEAKKAMENALKPKPTIVPAKDMPSLGLRP
jgi:hypothetical protein